MKKRTITVVSFVFLAIMIMAFVVACGSGNSTPTSGGTDGASLLQNRCSVCHSVSRVTSRTGTASEWKQIVDKMISNGAQLNATEEQTLVDYLAATYK